jgi:hypothetical protein
MAAKTRKKVLNLFQMMKDLNEQDKKLQASGTPINEANAKLLISNQVIDARSHSGGGMVSMGITGRTLMDLMTPGPTGKSTKICILCIIDKAAYDEYKEKNGFE